MKIFASKIDFEKYFDSIPSWYLKKQNDASKLSLTPHEKQIFTSFLHHKYSEYDVYSNNEHKRRIIGTPQGSSVSLLLANIATMILTQRSLLHLGNSSVLLMMLLLSVIIMIKQNL
jgi:hypothetical protein